MERTSLPGPIFASLLDSEARPLMQAGLCNQRPVPGFYQPQERMLAEVERRWARHGQRPQEASDVLADGGDCVAVGHVLRWKHLRASR